MAGLFGTQSFCQKSGEIAEIIFDNSPGIRTQAFATNKLTHSYVTEAVYPMTRKRKN